MNYTIDMEENTKMPITWKGLKLLIVGVVVLFAGYILMAGGGSDDPAVFNPAMFDFRRLVAVPLVILCGLIIEVLGIMGIFKKEGK